MTTKLLILRVIDEGGLMVDSKRKRVQAYCVPDQANPKNYDQDASLFVQVVLVMHAL